MKKLTHSSPRIRQGGVLIVSGAALVGNLFAAATAAQGAGARVVCPDPPAVVTESSEVPLDVCIPPNFSGNPIAFFDDYSWRAFLSLVWPASTGQRGVADPAKSVGMLGPRVFETYKAQWEIFHNDESVPVPWNQFDSTNACGKALGFGEIVLASFSKFSDLGQAGFGSLVGPLVAQNRTYVRYSTGFNKVAFEQIRANEWYLRRKLPAAPSQLTFEPQALDFKAAWVEAVGLRNPERYYTRRAWIMDLATGDCSEALVALIALHIAQKTPSRPQWIWSTFEQVDNVPPVQPEAPGTFTLNDGSGAAMPTDNPYPIDPPVVPVPPPFNVERLKPVHVSTRATNTAYRQALQREGAVWQFYQLVMTQWPTIPDSPALPGTPANTFPGTGTDQTAFSNPAMETFDQTTVRAGCMACHNATKRASDFVWALNDHAFPANIPNFLLGDPGIRELRILLGAERVRRSVSRLQSSRKSATSKKVKDH
jgi:hypothetical protein